MMKEKTGLFPEQVIIAREKYGDNSLEKEKTKGFFRKFFENLNDPIIKVLIFALVIEVVFTFGHCDFFEVFGIIAAVLIATTVSTVSEHGSELAFAKMQAESIDTRIRALRGGEVVEISSAELVVGDIVYIGAGEIIQADGFILSGNIKVDQSALNGESRDVTKCKYKEGGDWELSNPGRVYRGSIVVSGEAVMRVGRVGKSTYYGMVAKDVQAETRVSPLKLRLAKFAAQISKIGYVMAGIVALTYLFNTIVADNGFVWSRIVKSISDLPFMFSTLVHALTLMITVVVVAAPEGLPMMITVVLCANMKKMMRDGVLVKKLVGIETAGSMNILFTDKTGTITTGHLECDKIISYDGTYKNVSSLKKNKTLYNYVLMNAKHNTDAVVSCGKVIGGNGTDRALAEFFIKENTVSAEIVKKIPFSSEKKCSSVSFSDGITLVKGAPELIIEKSNFALCIDGTEASFMKSEIYEEYITEASAGNRVIAIGYLRGDGGMVFLALVVLKDKIRRGVRESVIGVKRAGVHVVMLTGDSKETASAIAKECGILSGAPTDVVITSAELSKMSDEEVKNIIPGLCVLARALPQDKTRLVRLSQELDLVVGMTGDGINDAPSLKLADIGFAMGTGADIAKSAGDVVILDNSFFAINRTVLYGRTIFKSIRKFITFQLIMNLTACGVSLVGQFLGIDSPITIIQMLWVNIIMDTLGGLAFAGEAPLEHYMKEKPKRRTEPILSRDMLNRIAVTGAYTLVMCVAFLRVDYFHSMFRASEGDVCFLTAFYALFIFSGIFNCFGARCERMWIFSNIGKNKAFVIIMAFIAVIQVVMIYYGGALFRTVPLLPGELLSVVLLSFTVVPFEMLRRIFYRLGKAHR